MPEHHNPNQYFQHNSNQDHNQYIHQGQYQYEGNETAYHYSQDPEYRDPEYYQNLDQNGHFSYEYDINDNFVSQAYESNEIKWLFFSSIKN